MMLNGKELKHCTDAELTEAWGDAVSTPHDLADAIIAEIDLRRDGRARSQFHYPPTPEIN
jgi:hypothetical protein